MGLFPTDQTAEMVLGAAPERMRWTRERGTRRLVIGFIALIVLWYAYSWVHDQYLLRQTWGPLTAQPSGLTIVGTLDSRGSYDRNLFRVVQANKTSRAEITDFGWRTIFNPENGNLFSEQTANAIRSAIEVDDITGYAMLEPFIRVGVAHLMGRPHPAALATAETPISLTDRGGKVTETTLGALIGRFSKRGPADTGEQSDAGEGGSGSGREVDHGLPIPGNVLADTCPVVLTGAQFTGGELDEHPASLLQGKTYTVHLYLTPEGRSRFYQWSRDHANENLCFVLRGKLETAGRIRQTLDVSTWEIGPLTDGDAAHALVDYVNRK